MPNYLAYHESLTDELHALKNRVRNLVTHWPTDGEYKEAALRTVLRRHLPPTLIVGRGFIVTPESSSSQIDLLIVDGNKPVLFRDGDLLFVTPDCVKAVIEVKTSLSTGRQVLDCSAKLCRQWQTVRDFSDQSPWLGVFCYDGALKRSRKLLDAVEEAYSLTGAVFHGFAYGKTASSGFGEKVKSNAATAQPTLAWLGGGHIGWRTWPQPTSWGIWSIGSLL